ncbi:MAG TPA: hypothetical protein VK602_03720 [Phyllobacterium sp.]|nr:hypothetical protein [Phyllobacterium sp.]
MKRILPALLILLCASEIASAQALESRMLQRQTARAIRNAGFWCDRITDARIDKVRSADGPTIVRVTCDDKTTFAQYSLTMNAGNNKITKIQPWK